MITHKEIGIIKVTYQDGSSTLASKLACGGIADAGTGVILSKNPTCQGCRNVP